MTNLETLHTRLAAGALLGPVLDAKEQEGVDAILKLAGEKHLNVADVAYILATAYHETAGTMQPIEERGGNGYFTRMYDITGTRPKLAAANGNTRPGDGIKYHGRGLVQITWYNNYLRIGKLLGIDLIADPLATLTMPWAVQIIVDGMIGGWFTGVKLATYLPRSGPAERSSFKEARRIINGQDAADKIASYALTFQADLIAAGWPQ